MAHDADRALAKFLRDNPDDTLPPPPQPKGLYRPAVLLEDECMLVVSGHGPMDASGEYVAGKVGTSEMNVTGARQAARLTALAMLATLKAQLGTLNRIKRVVKFLCMVNATADFTEHITVANGFAEVFQEVLGDAVGVGSRSAVGMGSLPLNIPFEAEATFLLNPKTKL